ncbi:MAG: hypothetical protein WBA31_03955 [Candidatus Dormiibacterota bacterium]
MTLRNETRGVDTRHLCAYLDDEGNLHIDGHDLGPATAVVSDDGEYEWFRTISNEDLPQLRSLLGEHADTNLLDVLEQKWTGVRSYDLEKLLRDSGIKVGLFVA